MTIHASVLRTLRAELHKAEALAAQLRAAHEALSNHHTPRRKAKHFSPEGLASMRRAQAKRWAKWRRENRAS
jgi:hypothetical protein